MSSIEVTSPFDGSVVGSVPFKTYEEVEAAINLAQTTFLDHKNALPKYKRVEILEKVVEIMSGQIDESNIEEEDWNDLNVLVVDDNEINRTVIGGMLGLYDISVGYAENGQLAVEAVKNGDYNCILMDIQMPVMDGYYATALIRKTHPEITIIALTAGGFEEFNSDIRSGDFNDFLRKPVVIEKILEVLQKTLHQVKAK